MEKLKFNFDVVEDKKLLAEMKQAYLDCPAAVKYCKEIGIPEEEIDKNITKIYDLVSDLNYCKNCPGVKKCAKNNPNFCTKIVYNYGQVERNLVPCKEFVKRITFEKQFLVKDFPTEWLDDSLRNIDRNKGRDLVLSKYSKYIKEDISEWIYINGVKNTGRSYLAAILCIDAAKRGYGPIAYVDAANKLKDLADVAFKDKELLQKKIENYSNVPILVLDNFGNEFKTDFIRDGILFPIISARSDKKLLTIFTSDFSLDEIETLYTTTKAGGIRAKQLTNLIRNMSKDEINLGNLSVY